MSGAIYKKYLTLEKDFNKASRGHALTAEMKAARQILKSGKDTAEKIDSTESQMASDIAKANKLLKTDLKSGMTHAAAATKAIKTLSKQVSDMSHLPREAAGVATKDFKAKNPQEYRSLKVLSTDLAAFVSFCEYLLKQRQEDVNNLGKQLTSEERRKGVHDKALLQLDKAVKRARGAIQKIKATPTEETWTKEFKYAGRDVKMAFVSLKAAQKGGGFEGISPAVTDKFYRQIMDWDTQKKMSTLKKGASEKEILARLKQFSAMIKSMSKEFKIG